MKKLNLKLLPLFIIIGTCVFAFQNCGSGGSLDGGVNTGVVGEQDGELTGIDDISTAEIQFQYSKLTLNNDAQSVVASGSCPLDQEGAVLSWNFVDHQNPDQILFKGKATCGASGVFSVSFVGAQGLACDGQYQLKAYFGGASTETLVSKICAN